MKIVLSRKGVDSSAGGFASPIFPDGRMISVPIPDQRAQVKYRDIQTKTTDRSIGKLVRDLSRGKLGAAQKVHLDPDLERTSLPRQSGWRPMFGQCGAAQSHLSSLGVGRGDLFLFFGWFRRVECYHKRWRFVSGAPDLHVLYGWMQVASVEPVEKLVESDSRPWSHYHPHCVAEFSGSNVIYVARRQLDFVDRKIAGAGVFCNFHDNLCLTDEGKSRSHWRLPLWMHPQGRNSALSYHTDLMRWQNDNSHALLRSAARGQEFVLDLEDYPEGIDWVRDLVSDNV